MEKEKALVSKVGKALIYPAFVMTAGLGVITMLITVTLPALAGLFKENEGQLPLPTQIMVGITTVVNDNLLIIA